MALPPRPGASVGPQLVALEHAQGLIPGSVPVPVADLSKVDSLIMKAARILPAVKDPVARRQWVSSELVSLGMSPTIRLIDLILAPLRVKEGLPAVDPPATTVTSVQDPVVSPVLPDTSQSFPPAVAKALVARPEATPLVGVLNGQQLADLDVVLGAGAIIVANMKDEYSRSNFFRNQFAGKHLPDTLLPLALAYVGLGTVPSHNHAQTADPALQAPPAAIETPRPPAASAVAQVDKNEVAVIALANALGEGSLTPGAVKELIKGATGLKSLHNSRITEIIDAGVKQNRWIDAGDGGIVSFAKRAEGRTEPPKQSPEPEAAPESTRSGYVSVTVHEPQGTEVAEPTTGTPASITLPALRAVIFDSTFPPVDSGWLVRFVKHAENTVEKQFGVSYAYAMEYNKGAGLVAGQLEHMILQSARESFDETDGLAGFSSDHPAAKQVIAVLERCGFTVGRSLK